MTEHRGPAHRRGLISTGIVAALVFVALAFLIHLPAVVALDRRVVSHATDITGSHPPLRSTLLAWQALAQPIWVYLTAVVLCWFATAPDDRRGGWWATGTVVAGWVLSGLLKITFHRPRPAPPHPVTHLSSWSFPSGHAVGMTLACAVVLLTWWPRLGILARRAAAVVSVVLVAVTCLDRVLLGVHFPTDVVAGAALGLGVACASYALAVRVSAPGVARSRE